MSSSLSNDYSLYKTAKEFNKTRPWKWLKVTDIFGIKIPDYDKIFYCSILGYDEIEFGLTIYEGTAGLANLLSTFTKEYSDYREFLLDQNGFAVYFNDRLDLPREDYDNASLSGVPFRGKKQWPAFRRYESGFVPVRPDEDELYIIEQVMKYSIDLIEDIKVYIKDEKSDYVNEDACLIREYTDSTNFVDKMNKYEDILAGYQKVLDVPIAYDELSIARLKRASKSVDAIWEVGYFHYPYGVEQDGLAFYPMNLLLVDAESQKIIGQHMTSPLKYAEAFQKYILTFIDESKIRPKEMVTDNEDLYCYLNSMLKSLGIKLTMVDKLYLIPHIQQEFTKMLEESGSYH